MKIFKKVFTIILIVAMVIPIVGLAVGDDVNATKEEIFISEANDLNELLDALVPRNNKLRTASNQESLEVAEMKAIDDTSVEIKIENVEKPIVVEIEDPMTEEFQEAMNNGNPELVVEDISLYSRSSERYIRISFDGRYSEFDIRIPLNMGEVVEINGGQASNENRIFRVEIVYQGKFINININIPINIDKAGQSIRDKNILAAKNVDEKIANLQTKEINLDDKEDIEEVRTDYNRLKIKQKKLVENLSILEFAEKEILKLEYEELDIIKERLEDTVGSDFHNREITGLRDVTSAKKRREVERRVREIIEDDNTQIYIKRENPIWNNRFEIRLTYGDAKISIENILGIFGSI